MKAKSITVIAKRHWRLMVGTLKSQVEAEFEHDF